MADIQEQKDLLKKYTASINESALESMAKTYALVMSKPDTKYVACGDQSEKDTVRENFLKKKLGLAQSDDDLNAAVDAVCATMKEDRFKSRLVFYYLLAEKFNKLSQFD
jgi:Protein of unknown function (DUF2853)